MRFYSSLNRTLDPQASPNAEVFYANAKEVRANHEFIEPGWYYWYCHPGYLPDSKPIGPYSDALEAIEACQLDDSIPQNKLSLRPV